MNLNFSRPFPYSLLAGTATVAVLAISQSAIAAKSPQEIAQIATPVTVQINPPAGVQDGGSGVIVQRQGNTYTVLTCNHVVKMPEPHTIRTHDGKSYSVTKQLKLQKNPNDPDLALLTFNSSANYPVATMAQSEVAVGAEIFVIGFPALNGKFGADRDFVFSPGYITSRPSNAPEGYSLRYNSVTKGGMSGGPVFDVDGRVIGIHGDGGGERISVKDEGANSFLSVVMKTGFNGAIPINTFLALRSQIGQTTEVAVDTTPSTDKPAERLQNPKSASDYLAKGLVQREQGAKSQAINNYTQAINRDSNYADAYYHRGNARYDQGDKQGALADYNQVISVNPDYANAYYQRAVIRYNQGDTQGALADFNRYISLSPDDIQAYYSRGTIRRSFRDAQGTFEDFDKVVRLAPDNARAYYNRALARTMLRDAQGALEDFNQALSLDPNWLTAYNNRAIHRRRMGDREGAIADFSKILSIDPKNATAYFNRGIVRRDLGDRQGAIADLQNAANLFQQQGDSNNYQKVVEKISSIEAMPVTQVNPQPNSSNLNQPTRESAPQPDSSNLNQPTPESAAPQPDSSDLNQPTPESAAPQPDSSNLNQPTPESAAPQPDAATDTTW